jgi:Spy/CpxP family protein refolding chaperone
MMLQTTARGLSCAFAVFAIVASHPVAAAIGDPSNDIRFQGLDLRTIQLSSGQRPLFFGAITTYDSAVAPIRKQVGAVRRQMSDLLAGSNPVELTGLLALQQQAAELGRQQDLLAVTEKLQMRSVLTSAQLVSLSDRHQQLKALRVQNDTLLHSDEPNLSSISPDDLYGDDLGYARGLALTDAQSQDMSNIEAAASAAGNALQAERKEVREQISALLSGPGTVTFAQIAPLQERASTLASQLDVLRLTMAVQIRSLLTPDQLAEAATLHQQTAALHAQERALRQAARATK